VLRTTGERVSVLVQACPAVTGSLGPESLHCLGSTGVERQVAEPRSAAVVIAVQPCRFEDDEQLDVVQRAERHRSFRRVFVLRVVVVRLKRAAPARLANTVSVLEPFGHDQ